MSEESKDLFCPWCGDGAFINDNDATRMGEEKTMWWWSCLAGTVGGCEAQGPMRPTEAEARADCDKVIFDRSMHGAIVDEQVGEALDAITIPEVEIYRAAAALCAGSFADDCEWESNEAAIKWSLTTARALAAMVSETPDE